ncbi:hypothetical protein [Xanthomonas arboricola]|uniref:hypothetical protein n=1 Tax=Xanthomonas arboricola TaxID=56448 RepID=UPI00118731ED|nr:hypothetical protein [Xanthomonas arboricola]
MNKLLYVLPIAAGVVPLLVVLGYTYLPSDTKKPAASSLAVALETDSFRGKAYDAFVQGLPAAAANGVEQSVAKAWSNCAAPKWDHFSSNPMPIYPAADTLDRCELDSVQLSVNRGYDRAEANASVQSLRERTERELKRVQQLELAQGFASPSR